MTAANGVAPDGSATSAPRAVVQAAPTPPVNTAPASCGFKGSSGYAELIAGPSIKDGNWHTVQCVKTSSAIKVIVDGQTFAKSGTVGSISNTEAVVIGARPGSEFFKGSLDEASIQIG